MFYWISYLCGKVGGGIFCDLIIRIIMFVG